LDPSSALVTLTVNRTGTGIGTVVSAPVGIDCGIDCGSSYVAGTAVALTATPAAGTVFTGWNGGGCSGTGTCLVTMTATTAVTAMFALQDIAVSLTPNPASGTAPLSTTLTATVSGTATGTINYTFWWDCTDPGT